MKIDLSEKDIQAICIGLALYSTQEAIHGRSTLQMMSLLERLNEADRADDGAEIKILRRGCD